MTDLDPEYAAALARGAESLDEMVATARTLLETKWEHDVISELVTMMTGPNEVAPYAGLAAMAVVRLARLGDEVEKLRTDVEYWRSETMVRGN